MNEAPFDWDKPPSPMFLHPHKIKGRMHTSIIYAPLAYLWEISRQRVHNDNGFIYTHLTCRQGACADVLAYLNHALPPGFAKALAHRMSETVKIRVPQNPSPLSTPSPYEDMCVFEGTRLGWLKGNHTESHHLRPMLTQTCTNGRFILGPQKLCLFLLVSLQNH